jgi:hypothetical protein
MSESESEAGLRIRVSRLGREFPEALQTLARGELHLTALQVLAPVLTDGTIGLPLLLPIVRRMIAQGPTCS